MTIRSLLHKYNSKSAIADIADLFAAEPGRFRSFSAVFEGLILDYSRTAMTTEARDDLLRTAQQAGLPAAVDTLFAGSITNAHHTLMRRSLAESRKLQGGSRADLSQMLAFARSMQGGTLPGCEDVITDIIHLGVGGSALGPQLVADALGGPEAGDVSVHYLAGADGHALTRLLRGLDAERTAFIVASKSFNTRETLLNASAVRSWLELGGVRDPGSRMLAITSARETAREYGVREELILDMSADVGGRYSVWSAIGLPAAIAIGADAFLEFLSGAQAMDVHFRTAPPIGNLPIMLALCGIWHRNICGYSNLAVMPYDDRLRLLPDWIEQLEMESNGKNVNLDGETPGYATAPAILRGLGTASQHSMFQALHQGTDVIPVEFIGVLNPDHGFSEHHGFQLANMLAQAEALMRGRSRAETMAYMEQSGIDTAQLASQLPHRTFPGNRPSITLILDKLTPHTLGQLLALYEHKVFVESVMWNINAFDQWGVEFGKILAADYERTMECGAGRTEDADDLLSWVMEKLNRPD